MPERSASADTIPERDGPTQAPPVLGLQLLYSRAGDRPRWLRELGREPIAIGRQVDEANGLRLDDRGMSKRHAELSWSPIRGGYWLQDLRSTNGSYVNGARIERQPLSPGDLIRLGDTVLRLAVFDRVHADWMATEPGFVGSSPALRRSLERVARVGPSPAPVLVLGETGVGKELIAQALHRHSGHRGDLCAVNCAAIPGELVESELFGHVKGAFTGADGPRPGLFRSADGGTLFLDEVGELSPGIQATFLRALETMRIRPVGAGAEVAVDVRVIAATNRDLVAEVERGRFRADLYARLADAVIEIAPLRERIEDLAPLWQHLVEGHGEGRRIALTGAAFEAMARHRWPFNVRELRQLVRHASLLELEGDVLGVEDLPASMRSDPDPAEAASPAPQAASSAPPTAQQLRQLVEELQGNVKEVAAFLGKDRTQIYRWLRRYGIDPGAYRGEG